MTAVISALPTNMSPLIGSSIITILGETIIPARLRRTFTGRYVVALGPSYTFMPRITSLPEKNRRKSCQVILVPNMAKLEKEYPSPHPLKDIEWIPGRH